MPSVVGRERELETIVSFLGPPGGTARVLLLEGEAGIGKTTVWAAAATAAAERGYRVLQSRPADVESGLSFAATGDLLAGVLSEVAPELPAPQRRALEIALVLSEPDGPPPEPNAIAFGFLSALRALSRSQPTLVAVDDVQWLDPASAALLLYAARRLEDEPARLLLARRIGEQDPGSSSDEWAVDPRRLERIVLGPLSLGAIQRMFTEQLGHGLHRSALHRIHEASRGNAFHALELGRALARSGATLSAGDPLPVSASLDALVGERLALLPPATVDALQVAALSATPMIAVLESALEAPIDLGPAVDAGFVTVEEGEVAFSHPLVSSSIAARIGETSRRDIHRRLAAVVPSLEQRARHLAVATEHPDEEVAAVLEQAAERAAVRGASRVAAELLDDAIRLTPAGARRQRRARLLAASRAWRSALDLERAATLASEALDLSAEAPEQAEALLELAACLQDPLELAELALAAAGTDPSLQAQLWTLVANRQLNLDAAKGLEAARRAVHAAERSGNDGLVALALAALGLAETVCCEGTPREHLERGIELERRVGRLPLYDSPSLVLAVHAALRDELDEARDRLRSLLEQARERGDERSQAHVLRQLARVELRAGRWRPATHHADESAELYEGSGDLLEAAAAHYIQATLAACRGDVDVVRERCRTARRLTGDTELSLRQERSAVGLLELGHGRYEEAATALDHGFQGQIEPGLRTREADLIEAFVGAGRLADAEELLTEWEALGRRLDRPRVLATGARCRGLLLGARGELEQALAALTAAMVHHERLAAPFERARTLLALGVVQRRAKRRGDARRSLEEARLAFERLGATVWEERARSELARVGGRAASPGRLTTAELRIAELVAEGRTNREVAGALFVTVGTVEAALTRAYRKLGVRSRTELSRVLGGRAPKL